MSDRFVVETGRMVVGVAVRSPGGFKFFSSDPAFAQLEGRTFPRARSLIIAVTRIGRLQRRIEPAPAPAAS